MGYKHRRELAARWKTLPTALTETLPRSGPIILVAVSTTIVAALHLGARHEVHIIGEIQGGLPRFTLPILAASEFLTLIPLALTISFVGFLENISVAKSLAAKRRQTVDPNQEFIALGAANLAAGVTGRYPVSGSFARSTVNFAAGANTGLASLITVGVVGMAALFLMPLFHHLPQAVLAAGITLGSLVGVASTLILHVWRTSRPHMAVVGPVADTEHFLNVQRQEVQTLPHVLLLRVDESLYFANAKHVQDFVLCATAENPRLRHLVLICNAINFIDASALETLAALRCHLEEAGIELLLSEIKGPVMDRLADTEFLADLGVTRVFATTVEAYERLSSPVHASQNHWP